MLGDQKDVAEFSTASSQHKVRADMQMAFQTSSSIYLIWLVVVEGKRAVIVSTRKFHRGAYEDQSSIIQRVCVLESRGDLIHLYYGGLFRS